MKKLLTMLLLCLALVMLCLLTACRGGDEPQDTGTEAAASGDATEAPGTDPAAETLPAGTETGADATGEPGTEPVTEPETQGPPALGEWLSLTAESMTVTADDKIVLRLTAVPGAETHPYTLTAVLSADEAGAQALDSQTPAAAASLTVTFPYPADKQADLLYITVTAVLAEEGHAYNGTTLETLSLRVRNGLPQLTPDGAGLVAAAMTADEKAHLVTGVSDPVKAGASGGTYAVPRLGVPSMTVNDGPAGVRYGTAVWYPSIANITSSWDTDLMARVGEGIGRDALAIGIDVVLGPGMNVQKNVLGGRNFEYSSEDPLLTGLAMSAYINGMQATGTGACIKHFAANNQETARGSVSANVTERALREIYLKGFGLAVKNAQPWTVMSSYNCLNGLHTSVNGDLLTGILRDEWGYDGMVMTDWGANGSMTDKVNAQNDLNMPGNASDPQDVLNALKSGKITDEQLTLCCRNILGAVAKSAICSDLHKGRVDQRAGQTLGQEVGPDTVVLLKNENILPYKSGTTLALFGNGINATVYGGAGSGQVNAAKTVSILNGLKGCDALNLYGASGNPFRNAPAHDPENPDSDIEVTEAYAKECAANADAALIVISRDTSEGADHSTLAGDWLLSAREKSMLERVSAAFRAAGKTVTVVLNTGDPIEVVSWRDSVDCILWLGYPGQEAGHVLASVVTGEVNPNAKLTMTWPTTLTSTPAAAYFPGSSSDVVYYEDIYVGYRYYTTFGVSAAYDFGYGLSYTEYAYSDFAVKQNADGTVTLTVTVKNVGDTAGREIVEFYVSKPETTQEQPVRELCGFAKTALLGPGESGTVTVTVLPEALMTYVTDGSKWIIDKGQYTFSVGASVTDVRVSETLSVSDTVPVQDVENRCVPDTVFDYIRKADYKVPDPYELPENLAFGKKAWSDYAENDSLGAANAVDGDFVTRWSGLGTPNTLHTWQVDLGEVYEIGKVDIRWESVSAPFTVWISTDGNNFEKIKLFPVDGSGQNVINLGGREARVIRLTIPKGGYVSIFEFSVYEATEEDRQQGEEEAARENIAKGKSASADNVQDAFVPSYAVDGNPETRWASVGSGTASWEVDLGGLYRIDNVTLYLESAWVPYRVEYSADGVTYKKIASGAKDQLMLVADKLSVEARYIRVVREGENWFSIYECEVYGEKK